MSHVRTVKGIISQVRKPFQPKGDPKLKLAEEIESCKRKIWECITPADRNQYMGKKIKKHSQNDGFATSYDDAKKKETFHRVKKTETDNKDIKAKGNCNLPKQTTTQIRSDIELKVFVMKVVELKKELRDRGCETSGLKKDLRARLISVLLQELNDHDNKLIVQSIPNVKTKSTTSAKSDIVINDTKLVVDEGKGKTSSTEERTAILESKTVSTPADEPLFANSNETTRIESFHKDDLKSHKHESIQSIGQNSQKSKNGKESFSSLQVEHHRLETEDDGKIIIDDQKENQNNQHQNNSSSLKLQQASKSKSIKDSTSTGNMVVTIQEEKELSFRDICQSNEENDQKKNKDIPVVIEPNNNKSDTFSDIIKKRSNEDDDIRPPSEVSCSSKSSGHSVKDMVSKFSGFSSLSSTGSGGSALSKGLQAKKEARQAKIAEMRAKSKPVASSKVALASKEYSNTLSSLNAVSKGGSTKKKNLAMQMREKAALKTYKNKIVHSASKTGAASVLGSASKRNFPFSNNSNSSNIVSVQDTLGTTLKQGPGFDTLGTTLKQGPSYNNLGTTLKNTELTKESKIMSPMDTYEISDRENSDTDDDSDVDDEKIKKRIPTWALRTNLYSALEDQYNGRIGSRRIDPDEIFPEVQSCDLEAIFGSKRAKSYRKRASSGNWAKDKVTNAEKLNYKKAMGFSIDNASAEI